MPVKIGGEGKSIVPILPKEIDQLVKEIRDRLCLKSHEKLSKYRSAPYSVHSPCRKVGSVSRGTCQQCTPVCKQSWKNGEKLCTCRNSSRQESPHKLLEKLLREQTLIQEAVRRLKSRVDTALTSQPMTLTANVLTIEKSQMDLCESGSYSKSSSYPSCSSSCSMGTVSPNPENNNSPKTAMDKSKPTNLLYL